MTDYIIYWGKTHRSKNKKTSHSKYHYNNFWAQPAFSTEEGWWKERQMDRATWGWAKKQWRPLQVFTGLHLYLSGEAFLLDSPEKRICGWEQILRDKWTAPKHQICFNPLQECTSKEVEEACVRCPSFVLFWMCSYYSWLKLCLSPASG